MLIIEIHTETIEETKPSTENHREDRRLERTNNHSQKIDNRFWKAVKNRVPGYLIQYYKDEK